MKHGYKRNGKIEYAKEIAIGALPNNSSKIVETGLSNVTYSRKPERICSR